MYTIDASHSCIELIHACKIDNSLLGHRRIEAYSYTTVQCVPPTNHESVYGATTFHTVLRATAPRVAPVGTPNPGSMFVPAVPESPGTGIHKASSIYSLACLVQVHPRGGPVASSRLIPVLRCHPCVELEHKTKDQPPHHTVHTIALDPLRRVLLSGNDEFGS